MTRKLKPWLRLASAMLFLLALATAVIADPVAPAATDLGEAATEFLEQLADASQSSMSVGGVKLTWREAPVYCQGMLDAAQAWKDLTPAQRDAMGRIADVSFSAGGWFMNAEVEAASYAIGLEPADGGVRHVLRDKQGKAVGVHWLRIISPSDMPLRLSKMTESDSVLVRLACGGISVDLRYLSYTAHDELLGKLSLHPSGRVVIATDIHQPAAILKLAAAADAAIAVHAKVLCGPVPTGGGFRINLLDKDETYKDIDSAITGGEFQDNGAVSMHLTSQAYLWYVPLHPSAAFVDMGVTLRTRALVIHELHHLVQWRMYSGAQQWPTWLAEGLAEYGTQCVLAAASREEGEAFHQLLLGHWRDAVDSRNLPPREDWLAGEMANAVLPFYSMSYMVVRRLAREPEKLGKLLKGLEHAGAYFDQQVAGAGLLEKLYGPIADLLASVADEALAEPRPMSVSFGHLDRVGDYYRLTPPRGLQGRVLMPQPTGAQKVELSGEFSFTDIGQRRVTFYFAYSAGRQVTTFVQLSLTPARATCHRYREDAWLEWGAVALDKALGVGEGGKPRWIKFKASIDTSSNRVVIELDGKPAATFTLQEFVSLKALRAGFGCDSGAAYFRGVQMN